MAGTVSSQWGLEIMEVDTMYIMNDGRTYYQWTEQRRSRGLFLLLIQGDAVNDIKAIVRKVALRQFGHWMTGTVRIGRKSFTVSGPYGSDGLPLTVDQETFEKYGLPLPQYLYDAWNHGGGWNSAGSEAQLMRQWALDSCKALQGKTPESE